jgi:hypothetical protein
VYSESLKLHITDRNFMSIVGAPEAAELLQLHSLIHRQIVDNS